MMPGGRNRSGPPEDSSLSRPRQRFSPFNYPDTRRSNFKIRATLVSLSATPSAHKTRAPNSNQHGRAQSRSTSLQGFPEDISPEASFVKLSDLLRPALPTNGRFEREYDLICTYQAFLLSFQGTCSKSLVRVARRRHTAYRATGSCSALAKGARMPGTFHSVASAVYNMYVLVP